MRDIVLYVETPPAPFLQPVGRGHLHAEAAVTKEGMLVVRVMADAVTVLAQSAEVDIRDVARGLIELERSNARSGDAK